MKQFFSLLCLGLLLTLTASAASAEPAFIGTKLCKKCHKKQFTSWEATGMGKALETLKPGAKAEEKKAAGLDPDKDYSTEAKCLGCHTTGNGKPGGYGSAEADEFAGTVGCESCHGAGGDYYAEDKHHIKNKEFKSADLVQYGFLAKPGADNCTTCHNENSPTNKAFDYEKALADAEAMHEHFDMKYEH